MIRLTAAVVLALTLFSGAAWAQQPPSAPNGIEMPQGYKDWRVIAISLRSDNNTMRVIIGNDAAIAAARSATLAHCPFCSLQPAPPPGHPQRTISLGGRVGERAGADST